MDTYAIHGDIVMTYAWSVTWIRYDYYFTQSHIDRKIM